MHIHLYNFWPKTIHTVKSIDIDKKSFYVDLTQVRKEHINTEDVWIIAPNMIKPELTYFL